MTLWRNTEVPKIKAKKKMYKGISEGWFEPGN
jgi:hypothetical protein